MLTVYYIILFVKYQLNNKKTSLKRHSLFVLHSASRVLRTVYSVLEPVGWADSLPMRFVLLTGNIYKILTKSLHLGHL